MKDLIRQYKPVLRWNYDKAMAHVATTELGVSRALIAGLGGKTPDKIPSFEDAARKRRNVDRLPKWQRAFEKVNGDRVIQTG